MIYYESGRMSSIFRLAGSVLPMALKISFPNSLLTGALAFCVYELNVLGTVDLESTLMKNNAIWGGFSFLLGFLVVFRTSQAYSRFWEGCTSTHYMGAEWFDACAALIAFCKHAEPEKAREVLMFQNILVRLFSMLHSTALGDIEDCSDSMDRSAYQAFKMELIDAAGIDDESLSTIRESDCKVELIFQWIQQLVVENIKIGVMSIPPPILTRSFQEMASGMVHFHNALKISTIPFPYPYAQTCDIMLLMHWMIVPFIVIQWVDIWWLSCMFGFVQVVTLWSLNLIAQELEQPFGSDPNDIDAMHMQKMMNSHLRLLVKESTKRTPKLRHDDLETLLERMVEPNEMTLASFYDVWEDLDQAQGIDAAGENRETIARRGTVTTAHWKLQRSKLSQLDSARSSQASQPRRAARTPS
ncbi:unnamed protein product [Prorocentrum cordatum]|uniref:Bestrophin homolog n=2 Tax=Prorocentrum cordatum TaxID=2364126 RepID=A0ABN9PC41_9DINO|nr:unnamed protein product [Polarella glacialis]